MGRQDGVKGLGMRKCVSSGLVSCMFTIWIYFYYLLLFVIHELSLDKLVDLLMYFNLSMMCCILAELLYVCQTVGV